MATLNFGGRTVNFSPIVQGSLFQVPMLIVLALAAGALAHAEAGSPVRPLGGGLLAIGRVTLNQSNRSIRFPAAVQLREETVEYVVVHKTGKTHESIFQTEARPEDVHVAMLLLGVKPVMTNQFGADGKGPAPGEKVRVEVSWTNRGRRVECAAEDLILNKETGKTPARGPWIYNGSNFSEGMFTAQRDGSIVSIRIDPDALVNNPRPGRENDDLFKPHAAKLPSFGKEVEITIRLGDL
jgi:hypothetical protein